MESLIQNTLFLAISVFLLATLTLISLALIANILEDLMKSCIHSQYTKNDHLMFCSHQENKHDHEGNCSKEICPYGPYFYKQIKEKEDALEELEDIKSKLMQLATSRR